MSLDLVLVTAGNGPAEVRAFVARLARRLERLCESQGLRVHEITHEGPEEAPASVRLCVSGGAGVVLAGEVGTHQLIARSPRRGPSSRKRWFAAVSLHQQEDEAAESLQELSIQEKDLVVSACRASGSGGQHVNKVSTAVRVLHKPSGVSVRVASERSQRQNIRIAMARIAAMVSEGRAQEKRTRSAHLRQSHRMLVRGSAVRTYRLTATGELDPIDE